MIRFINGSEVYFRHLQDERALAALLSLSVRWFGIDQAEEVHEAAFLTLIGRIGRTDVDSRTGIKQAPPWGALVGNPAGHNWIWRRWVKDGGKNKRYEMHEATTMDNPRAPPDYINRLLEEYSPYWVERYVYGSWDAFKGQVYEEFDQKFHVIDPFVIPAHWKSGLGVDFGFNHPTVFLWCAIDYEGNIYVYDELCDREKLPDYYAGELFRKGIRSANGGILPIYAPHDTMNRNAVVGINLQQAYADLGIPLLPGNRSPVSVRIQKIKQYLRIDPYKKHLYNGGMGCPKIFIMRNCEKLIDEMGLYRWKDLRPGDDEKREQPDEVVKVNDDACDALGYWFMGWMARTIPERPKTKSESMFDLEAIIAEDLFREAI